MGNGFCKLSYCFFSSSPRGVATIMSEPLDEGLGHSFCYVRRDASRILSSKVHSEESADAAMTMFKSISGASVSANASTPLSTALVELCSYNPSERMSATFECSNSFASVPLQPVPRLNSGPLGGHSGGILNSGSIERGFLSGPIERGFLSGPIDGRIVSGPLDGGSNRFRRSFSHGGFTFGPKSKKRRSLVRILKKAIARTVGHDSIVTPERDLNLGLEKESGINEERDLNLGGDDSPTSQNLQWAHGKAGEDRVHVVVSEEQGWVFVGIYDGFNGPDATDYLLSNLYSTIDEELKRLLWEERPELDIHSSIDQVQAHESNRSGMRNQMADGPFGGYLNSNSQKSFEGEVKKLEENQKRWRGKWDRERVDHERISNKCSDSDQTIKHSDVLKALSRALIKTEMGYLDIADKMTNENPELSLMGSCVLVMLMKGDDVYLMNVGDCRAVLAQNKQSHVWGSVGNWPKDLLNSTAIQLTLDHSTGIKEEVQRIRTEHSDDASAVVNDRVKGTLRVTRAFGAGFLKQPKWNNALLEMFRINYIGTSPYITCVPSLCHHRLSPKDRFLILSSDGLYQYFSNEEVVVEVETFMASSPEGDPAQHLIEEVLFRAAKKAGMEFHELLEIPQGERRQYHDDISVIVISFEGRIWRSSI